MSGYLGRPDTPRKLRYLGKFKINGSKVSRKLNGFSWGNAKVRLLLGRMLMISYFWEELIRAATELNNLVAIIINGSK